MKHSVIDAQERARTQRLMRLYPAAVFVFGSNRKGIHGAGAAAFAASHYGAKRGVGEGRRGQSYAIPTKATWQDGGMPLPEIAAGVDRFIAYARDNPLVVFVVTRIGCGYAGFTDAAIAPLFRDAPANCKLPDGWRELAGAA